MPEKDVDIWVPETRLGHIKLIYFGMLIAAICVGGNIAIGYLWSALVQSTIAF